MMISVGHPNIPFPNVHQDIHTGSKIFQQVGNQRTLSSPFCSHLPFVLISLLFSSPFCSHLPFVLISLLFSSPFCSHLPFVLISLLFSSPFCSHLPFLEYILLPFTMASPDIPIQAQKVLIPHSLHDVDPLLDSPAPCFKHHSYSSQQAGNLHRPNRPRIRHRHLRLANTV
jgi:hypothetical protein